MTTVGIRLVEGLIARGIDTVFGIPGVHTIELYRGLANAGDRIRHVTPRHEQGAGFMADGYARVSGKPAAAFVITGRERLRGGAARVAVRFALGGGTTRTARLVFVREGGEWRVDDLFTPDMPRGLGLTIRETIAEDEALARAAGR